MAKDLSNSTNLLASIFLPVVVPAVFSMTISPCFFLMVSSSSKINSVLLPKSSSSTSSEENQIKMKKIKMITDSMKRPSIIIISCAVSKIISISILYMTIKTTMKPSSQADTHLHKIVIELYKMIVVFNRPNRLDNSSHKKKKE